ncbi:RBBP9/YdeN family alpha/beta hydrolase [Dyadobacter tibetensis]|uniref:RBBP9/YdeN family alpha/beta hydrolase n=1 Tax=Dyadobacter tibetensis TaxID=1211851 RepID=UPI0004706E47|nr:alpha/beta hydrolase [Dyadobacter tibetensis]
MSQPFLVIPGLASSGPLHWQSIWQQQYPHLFKRVEQDNWDWPVMVDWVGRLQEEVSRLTAPVYLVAHSMGCITVAHWAQQFSSEFVKGAMLVAPADADLSRRLSFVEGFRPIPSAVLPFKSIVVASTNDMYASLERSTEMASRWGSELINLGEKGHLNAVSGLGDWPEGKSVLERLSGVKLSVQLK